MQIFHALEQELGQTEYLSIFRDVLVCFQMHYFLGQRQTDGSQTDYNGQGGNGCDTSRCSLRNILSECVYFDAKILFATDII